MCDCAKEHGKQQREQIEEQQDDENSRNNQHQAIADVKIFASKQTILKEQRSTEKPRNVNVQRGADVQRRALCSSSNASTKNTELLQRNTEDQKSTEEQRSAEKRKSTEERRSVEKHRSADKIISAERRRSAEKRTSAAKRNSDAQQSRASKQSITEAQETEKKQLGRQSFKKISLNQNDKAQSSAELKGRQQAQVDEISRKPSEKEKRIEVRRGSILREPRPNRGCINNGNQCGFFTCGLGSGGGWFPIASSALLLTIVAFIYKHYDKIRNQLGASNHPPTARKSFRFVDCNTLPSIGPKK